MISAKNQERALVAAAILVAVAGCASLSGLISGQNRTSEVIAAATSLASLAIVVMVMRSGSKAPGPAARSQAVSPDLSARLLTIQEEERKNLSRELHDSVGQTVTALKMELARLNVADSRDAWRLDRARALADDTLRTIRNISLLLRPAVLDDLGLEAAMQWQAEDFLRRTSVPCELRCSLPDDRFVPEAVRTCIYRIVQEALNNCEKHAAASKVQIEVRQISDSIAVSVADDGRGSPQPAGAAGLGILGMKERAAILGGRLEFISEAGRGSRVNLTVPLAVRYIASGTAVH
jgi:signal transduction histidine kinase